MKNGNLYFIIIAVIAGFFSGCSLNDKINGDGNITSTERIATGFTGIILEGAGNINIYFSENYKVIVTTDSNIQDIVTIEAKNGLLYVDEKRGEIQGFC
jgi:ABC-type Fe3+-hydroxamate transport system substrate-binding protein